MSETIRRDPINIIHMPYLVLEKVFSFLSFDDIAKCRMVCNSFNTIASQSLNRGYYSVEKYHKKLHKSVRSLLPRRESERRAHPLAKKNDILQAIETRLSMLSMTFSKYMETQSCCFIPGKVIDELYRVLRVINNSTDITEKGHELLEELRDISSMAMEHFDEKIVPAIKKKLDAKRKAEFPVLQGTQILRHQLHNQYIKTNGEISFLRKKVLSQSGKINKLIKANLMFKLRTKKYISLFKKSQEQVRCLMKTVTQLKRQSEVSNRMSKSFEEEKQRITDMVKRVETCECKITEMISEVPDLSSFDYSLKCKSLNLSSIHDDSVLDNNEQLSQTEDETESHKKVRILNLISKENQRINDMVKRVETCESKIIEIENHSTISQSDDELEPTKKRSRLELLPQANSSMIEHK